MSTDQATISRQRDALLLLSLGAAAGGIVGLFFDAPGKGALVGGGLGITALYAGPFVGAALFHV